MCDESGTTLAQKKPGWGKFKSLIKRIFSHRITAQCMECWRRKKSLRLALIVLGIISGLILAAGVWFLNYAHNRVIPGITVSGIKAGNLTLPQAKTTLAKGMDSVLKQKLVLKVNTEEIEIPLQDLGLSFHPDQALETAFERGRKGNAWERTCARLQALMQGYDIPMNPVWDETQLTASLQKTLASYNRSAKDASLTITSDNLIQITPERLGLEADIPSLSEQIRKLNPFLPETLVVPFRQVSPAVTAAQLEQQKITGLLASFTTQFDPNLRGRTENIRLAAQALDDTLIKPGEEFSFNQTVGERTAAAGYQEAMIIENGRFVPGLGGGICQVSSTLYNVVLNAGLQVSERHPHNLPVAYVAPGKDATVAWGSLDFQFRNNSDGYALIKCSVGTDSITIKIYGKDLR